MAKKITQNQIEMARELEAKIFLVGESESNPLLRTAKLVSLRKPLEKVPETHPNYPVAERAINYINHLLEMGA